MWLCSWRREITQIFQVSLCCQQFYIVVFFLFSLCKSTISSMLAELGPLELRTSCHAEYNMNWIMEGLVINCPSGTLPLSLCLSDSSQELKKKSGSNGEIRLHKVKLSGKNKPQSPLPLSHSEKKHPLLWNHYPPLISPPWILRVLNKSHCINVLFPLR